MKTKISDLKIGDEVITYLFGKGLVLQKYDNIVTIFNHTKHPFIEDSEIDWQKTNELNNTKMNEILIEAPTGMEIYQENNTIKFRNIENKLPMSVEEIPNRNWFITNNGDISNIIYNQLEVKDKNNLSTKERAEAFLALMQLVELRDKWNGDSERHQFLITLSFSPQKNSELISFKTFELRNQFAEQFKDLIETAKELL